MKVFRKLIAAAFAVVTAAVGVLAAPAEASNVINSMYASKYNLVTRMLRNDTETMQAVKDFGRAVVFISVSDGGSKAKVALTQSTDLDTALKSAYDKAKGTGVVPKWFKLDVVVSDEEKTYSQFMNDTKALRPGGMRSGISFNSYYGTALLEAQINSSGMIDYETGALDLTRINTELGSMGKKKLTAMPKTLRQFKTQGYFAENTALAYKMINGTYGDTGRRELAADRSTVEMLADRTSAYLSSICGEDGKFVYGYYPIDNEEIEGYNILRHAGTVWNLIMQYDMCRDEELVPVIRSALGYLKKQFLYKDNKTAFVVDGTRLNIGGNGLALLAYTTYEEVFGSSEYNSLIRALANGIIYMQKSNGSFTHTLYKHNYSVAEDYVIVYYDGEAAYGMLKAYGVIGDSKYLMSARKAADYFVTHDYISLHSHWMAYTFNEITKYLPEERYFEFGLKNVDTDKYSYNMSYIRAGVNSASETVNCAFEMYDRLIRGGYKCSYLDTFDAKQLLTAVKNRAAYGLNYFMFPEYAMYFKNPKIVLNSLAVREDKFRIRIDDIQHFMDGYYLYWKNYDIIGHYEDVLTDTHTKQAA
ncbi:MAG: hypothetical protein IK093_14220 [Ruminiclostridium sp.]|nr:hypothetical protein [Ruminiclostridium sp.]